MDEVGKADLRRIQIVIGCVIGVPLAGFVAYVLLRASPLVDYFFSIFTKPLAWLAYVLILAGAGILVIKGFHWARREPIPAVYDVEKTTAWGTVKKTVRWVQGALVPHPKYGANVTTISESSHFDPRLSVRGEPLPELPAPVPEDPALPGPTDLAQVLAMYRPHSGAILLALGPGGKLITCTSRQLSHVALAGPTGGGKSNIVRLLMALLLAAGEHVWLADPHFTPVDPVSGEDWRPIAARLAQPPLTEPLHIAGTLEHLVTEMRRRYLLRAQGTALPPGFLFIEEVPAVLAGLDKADRAKAAANMAVLLREARKVGLYIVTASQDYLTATIAQERGGEIRSNLLTAYWLGGGLGTAKAILTQDFKMPATPLSQGEGVLRNASVLPEPSVLRVPLASNQALYQLLPLPGNAGSTGNSAGEQWGTPEAAPVLAGNAGSVFRGIDPLPPLPRKPISSAVSLSPSPPEEQAKTPVQAPQKAGEREREKILALHQEGYKPYQIASMIGKGASYVGHIKHIIATSEGA